MLAICLDAVAQQTWSLIEVVIVDNEAKDEDLRGLWKGEGSLTALPNLENVGFAKSANQGLSSANGDFFLLLNSDAVLDRPYVERCVAGMVDDVQVAAVSGKLMKLNREGIIDTTGHILYGDRRVGDRGEWETDRGQYDTKEEVFSVAATAALYRNVALQQLETISGEVFDESFFSYGEDVDVCWRLRLIGWKIVYLPDAVGRHRRAVSGERTPSQVLVWDLRNRYLRIVKNDSVLSVLRHAWELLLTEIRLGLFFLFSRPFVLPAVWLGFLRRLPGALRKRRAVQATRVVSWKELEQWFVPYDYSGFVGRLFSKFNRTSGPSRR